MPLVTTIYRRDELYEQIWTRPIHEVARQYGVTSPTLVRACKKLHVRTPDGAYWARKAAGQNVKPARLPRLPAGVSPEHRVERWKDETEDVEIGAEVRELLTREEQLTESIPVPSTLRGAHHWVRESARLPLHLASINDHLFADFGLARAIFGVDEDPALRDA